MQTVYLALGSNMGDSRNLIQQAITRLHGVLHAIQEAPVYETKPVGFTDQPNFVNTAISGTTSLSPEELLRYLKQVEEQLGRAERFRWGPREIDIDIILYGSKVQHTADLTLPHPRFRERDFVLQPLIDLNPKLMDPVSEKTVVELLSYIAPDQRSIIPPSS